MNEYLSQYNKIDKLIKSNNVDKANQPSNKLIKTLEDKIFEINNQNGLETEYLKELKILLFKSYCKRSQIQSTRKKLNDSYATLKKAKNYLYNEILIIDVNISDISNNNKNNNNSSNNKDKNELLFMYNYAYYIHYLNMPDDSDKIKERDRLGIEYLKSSNHHAEEWHHYAILKGQQSSISKSAYWLCDTYYSLAEQYSNLHYFSLLKDLLTKIDKILDQNLFTIEEFYQYRYRLHLIYYMEMTMYDEAYELISDLALMSDINNKAIDEIIDEFSTSIEFAKRYKEERHLLERSLQNTPQSDQIHRINIQIDIINTLNNESNYVIFDLKYKCFKDSYEEIYKQQNQQQQRDNITSYELELSNLYKLFSNFIEMTKEFEVYKLDLISLCELNIKIKQQNEYIIAMYLYLYLLSDKDKLNLLNMAESLLKKTEETQETVNLYITCCEYFIDSYRKTSQSKMNYYEMLLLEKQKKKADLVLSSSLEIMENQVSSLDLVEYDEQKAKVQSNIDRKLKMQSLVLKNENRKKKMLVPIETPSTNDMYDIMKKGYSRKDNYQFETKFKEVFNESGDLVTINKETGQVIQSHKDDFVKGDWTNNLGEKKKNNNNKRNNNKSVNNNNFEIPKDNRHHNRDINLNEIDPENVEYGPDGKILPCYTDEFVVSDSEEDVDYDYLERKELHGKRKSTKQRHTNSHIKKKKSDKEIIDLDSEESLPPPLTIKYTQSKTKYLNLYQQYHDILKLNGTKENKKLIEIFNSFQNNVSIEFISFESTSLNDLDSNDVFSTLSKLKLINEIDYSENQIGIRSIDSLMNFFKLQQNCLTNINLSNCQLTTNIFSRLYHLELPTLTLLNLSNNLLFDLKSFIHCPNLIEINLENCSLTDRSLVSILKYISSSPIRSLNLSSNQLLTPTGLQELLGIKFIPNLTSLSLRRMNQFGESMTTLFKKCGSLQHLDIGQNQLRNKFQKLIDFFQSTIYGESIFGDLHTLVIDEIHLPSTASFGWITKLSRLDTLDLSMNEMIGHSFFKNIRLCLKLNVIKMSRCNLSKLQVVSILYHLPSSVRIANFSFNSNSSEDSYSISIDYQPLHLPNLTDLELYGCGFTIHDPIIEQLSMLYKNNIHNEQSFKIDIQNLFLNK